jgi:hypothetical protein
MQAAAYAIMYEELTKIPINRLAVLIAVEEGDPQVFTEFRDKWVSELLVWRDNYENLSTSIDR